MSYSQWRGRAQDVWYHVGAGGDNDLVHPVLVELPFSLRLYSYGIMLGLAYAVGFYLTLALAERDGLDRARVLRAFAWSAIAALVGARALGLLVSPPPAGTLLDYIRLDRGGIVAYGGFLGGFLGAYLFCRRSGLPLGAWVDAAAPALGSGLFLTRIGCFLAGCDFGARSDGPLAVCFPAGSPAWRAHREADLLSPSDATSLPVHPTQLYESLAGLLLLGLVLMVRRRGRRNGEALAAFAIGYAALRFAIETVRGDLSRGHWGPWSTSQWIAMITAGAAIVYAVAARFLLRRTAPWA